MGRIRAVCISRGRGTPKQNVGQARLIRDWGLQGDAHAGSWHRQVSLLSLEKIRAFEEKGLSLEAGAFGENLVVEGLDPAVLPVGTLLACGEAVLEVTQIGKQCHQDCEIRRRTGDCIMPREGVFARVKEGGRIAVGDEIAVCGGGESEAGNRFRAAVVTVSDKGAAGLREDGSGKAACDCLTRAGYSIVETVIVPDEQEQISQTLCRLADTRGVQLILTSGGTGFSPRDVTPEATLAVAERSAPGIAEAIRSGSMAFTPRAMLSRAVSVIRGRTLIVNLPGSPRAVAESLGLVLPQLRHGLEVLAGGVEECAADRTGSMPAGGGPGRTG